MDGSIDKATEMIAKLHPTVLEHPVPLPMLSKSAASRPGTPPAAETAIPPVLFYLKVRRFIDLVGLMAQKSAASAEPHTPVRGKAPAATPRTTRSRARGGSAEHVLDEAADDGIVMGTPSRNAGTAASQGDADDSMDDSEDAMELDSQGTGARNAARVSSRHRNVGSGGMAGSRPSRAEEVPATPSKRSRGSRSRGGPADETEDNLLQLVMALGQALQNEFGGDEREPYRTTLQVRTWPGRDQLNEPLIFSLPAVPTGMLFVAGLYRSVPESFGVPSRTCCERAGCQHGQQRHPW
jgi:hypothetical protein